MRDLARRMIEPPPFDGHPAPYVAARAEAWKGAMVRQWGPYLFAPRFVLPVDYEAEGPVAGRQRDVPWAVFYLRLRRAYADMDIATRERFAPVLLFHELKVLFSALRLKAREDSAEQVRRLLGPSLLRKGLSKAIIGSSTQAEAAGHIHAAFARLLPGGEPELRPRMLEMELTGNFIKLCCAPGAASPEVRPYFMYIASMRNIITVHKHLRWLELLPVAPEGEMARVIPCGVLHHGQIERAGSEAEVMELVRRLSRKPAPGLMGNMEGVMLSGLLRVMRILSHTGATSLAVIMDWAVRAYAEARNLSIIAATRDLDRELVKEELAQ